MEQKRGSMRQQYTKDELYAALKLIENLVKQGRVKERVFVNILKDYKNDIDISKFECYNIS